jgi:lysophospholipid hydrolase
LKEPPLVKTDTKELHPDVNTTDPPLNFHNYLDDFLEAVRIFGFLEKPVFHELARHLQTRRLLAGDSISLDQDKNFYCVVDGLVQVYTKTGETQLEEGAWGEGSMKGYQLLNEVGSGGTLSSLFTILSLFTEDVRISWQDNMLEEPEPGPDIDHPPPPLSDRSRYRSDSDVSHIELDQAGAGASFQPTHLKRNSSISSSGSTVQGSPSIRYSRRTQTRSQASGIPEKSPEDSAVALAVEDATLAVIPAEAFRRLVKQFPKASAHIVQGVC